MTHRIHGAAIYGNIYHQYGLPSFTIIYQDLPSFTIIYQDLPSFTINLPSIYGIIYPYIPWILWESDPLAQLEHRTG